MNTSEDMDEEERSTRSLFSTFRTVTVGTYTDVRDLVFDLSEKGYSISEVRNIVQQKEFRLVEEKRKIDLVAPTLDKIGLPYSATTRDIVVCGMNNFGLEMIPPEAMVRLRIAYIDQPDGERCIGIHKPISTSAVDRRLLRIVVTTEGAG